jgi:hypothetical protein
VVFQLCVGAVKLLGKAFAFLPVHRHKLMELRDLLVFLFELLGEERESWAILYTWQVFSDLLTTVDLILNGTPDKVRNGNALQFR